MMAYFPTEANGSFWARLDTIGTNEAELVSIAPPTPANTSRLATIRENMRCAFEMLAGAEPLGRG